MFGLFYCFNDFAESCLSSQPVRPDLKAAGLVDLLAGIIRRGQKSGEFRRRTEPTVAALTACSAFFALIYTWVRHDGKIDIEGAVAETLDIILNGISEKKSKRG